MHNSCLKGDHILLKTTENISIIRKWYFSKRHCLPGQPLDRSWTPRESSDRSGQPLDSSTATGQVWIRVFLNISHTLGPKPSILQHDNRILHHLIWIEPKITLSSWKQITFSHNFRILPQTILVQTIPPNPRKTFVGTYVYSLHPW